MATQLQIATKDGSATVPVYKHIGPFAIHYTLESLERFAKYGKKRRLGEWSLTHVPSGMSVLCAYSTKPLLDAAISLLETASFDHVDWEKDFSSWSSREKLVTGRAVNLLRAANVGVH